MKMARVLPMPFLSINFNLAFFQFIWECNSENIIKIGPYLPKLLQEKFGAVFLAHPVHANWCTGPKDRFSSFFTATLSEKFALKWSINVPLIHIVTVHCAWSWSSYATHVSSTDDCGPSNNCLSTLATYGLLHSALPVTLVPRLQTVAGHGSITKKIRTEFSRENWELICVTYSTLPYLMTLRFAIIARNTGRNGGLFSKSDVVLEKVRQQV